MSSTNRFKYILGIIFFTVLSVNTIKSASNVLKSKDRLDQVNKEVEKMLEFAQSIEYIYLGY